MLLAHDAPGSRGHSPADSPARTPAPSGNPQDHPGQPRTAPHRHSRTAVRRSAPAPRGEPVVQRSPPTSPARRPQLRQGSRWWLGIPEPIIRFVARCVENMGPFARKLFVSHRARAIGACRAAPLANGARSGIVHGMPLARYVTRSSGQQITSAWRG